MKRSTVLLLSLLTIAAVPAFAQVNDTYVIPASIDAAGAFGTRWQTQVSVFNPQIDRDLNVTIVFLPTGGSQGDSVTVKVPANSVAFSDNIVRDLKFPTSSGSLLFATFTDDNPGTDRLSRSFLVTSNTFNNSANGTYGQTIPGIWTGLQDYATDGISGVVHGIRHIAKEGWRTNFGAVNLGRCTARLLVTIYDVDGNTLRSKVPFTLPPQGHMQDTLPIEVDRGSIEFFVDDPCYNRPNDSAVVFAYTSTIDQLSGDPSYQTPVLLADPKSIYAKKLAAGTTDIGTKLDNERARQIRDGAVNHGAAQLVREASGWRITK